MKLRSIKIGDVENFIYCLFIVVFLSMNNIRGVFLLFEGAFILIFIMHYFKRSYPLTILLLWGMTWLFACFLSIMFADIRQIGGCISVAQMVIVINLIYPLMHDDEKYFKWFLNCFWVAAFFLLIRQVAVSGFDARAWTRIGSDFGYNANYVGVIGAYAGIFAGMNFFYYRKFYGLIQLALALVIVFLNSLILLKYFLTNFQILLFLSLIFLFFL